MFVFCKSTQTYFYRWGFSQTKSECNSWMTARVMIYSHDRWGAWDTGGGQQLQWQDEFQRACPRFLAWLLYFCLLSHISLVFYFVFLILWGKLNFFLSLFLLSPINGIRKILVRRLKLKIKYWPDGFSDMREGKLSGRVHKWVVLGTTRHRHARAKSGGAWHGPLYFQCREWSEHMWLLSRLFLVCIQFSVFYSMKSLQYRRKGIIVFGKAWLYVSM